MRGGNKLIKRIMGTKSIQEKYAIIPVSLIFIGMIGMVHQRLTWGAWFELCDINHEVLITACMVSAASMFFAWYLVRKR